MNNKYDVPISVVSWNCLADSYSRGPCAELTDQVDILSWSYRSKLIYNVLSNHDADVVCLQEVDHFNDFFNDMFDKLGYSVEYAKRSGKQDGILIAFKRNKFSMIKRHVIYFDDLSRITPIPAPLNAHVLRRHNLAIVLQLSLVNRETVNFLICTTHLYWNPKFPSVKLAQTHFLVNVLANLRVNDLGRQPCAVLLTGDFNSEPQSEQHSVITQGCSMHPVPLLDAASAARKAVANVSRMERKQKQKHWRRRRRMRTSMNSNENNNNNNNNNNNSNNTEGCMSNRGASDENGIGHKGDTELNIRNSENHDNNDDDNNIDISDDDDDDKVKFLCDATLTNFARWLRLLGVDTAIEDKASQDRRAIHNDYNPLFSRARRERRILVTTSTTMQKRNTCPETFLIQTSSSKNEMKKSLASLLTHYQVRLDKESVFSICGKCGGRIVSTAAQDVRLKGRFVPGDRKIFICEKCHQPYWYSDRPEGCSSRAESLAFSLFAYVEAAKRRYKRQQDQQLQTYQHLNLSEKEKQAMCKKEIPQVSHCQRQWLRLESAFEQVHGREPECTNINGPFRATLDYIFVAGAVRTCHAITQRHVVEMTEKQKERTEHKLFPNLNWPSDHLLLRAEVMLRTKMSGRLDFPRSMSADCLCDRKPFLKQVADEELYTR